jgi:Uma2 family endonuclease
MTEGGESLPEIDFSQAVRGEPYRGKGMILMRWVETPDGRLEQVAFRLTPELFLHQTYEDRVCHCTRHNDAVREMTGLLESHFSSAEDVSVFHDLLHLLGPGLPTPSPDVSVVRGLRRRETERYSLDLEKDGVRPCLIIEVVSPDDRHIRRTDLKDKVEIYALARIPEYVIVDSTLRDRNFRLLGYRLDRSGRYQSIQPDNQGRILSETTGLWFQISPDGNGVLLFKDSTGERLLTRAEEEELRKAAEERARAAEEKAARAEAELNRLRAELERLRGEPPTI